MKGFALLCGIAAMLMATQAGAARFLLLGKDLGNGRGIGDPVSIVADSHVFSINEDIREWTAAGNEASAFPDLFLVIDIPGMPVVVARRMMEQWKRPTVPGDPGHGAGDPEDQCVLLHRHRWRFGVADLLPVQIRLAIQRDRYVSLVYDIPALNTYIQDRAGTDIFDTPTPVRTCPLG